ncbi:MAG TPA: hypothetical protein VKM55_07615 [Candidatus Lokiarchaeia archaeon]|nr:hypothetical protein [Candidatus Lokiarchaeia archaeon]
MDHRLQNSTNGIESSSLPLVPNEKPSISPDAITSLLKAEKMEDIPI